MTSAIEELAELLAHVEDRLGKMNISHDISAGCVWKARLSIIKAREELHLASCYLIQKEND